MAVVLCASILLVRPRALLVVSKRTVSLLASPVARSVVLASSPEEAIRMIRDGVAEFVEHVTSVSDA